MYEDMFAEKITAQLKEIRYFFKKVMAEKVNLKKNTYKP